jgi:GNAT superfamily N-acetyltransferase
MPPPAPTVRPASPADAPAIAPLLAELGYPTAPDLLPARLDAILAEHGAAYLALAPDGQPLGFMTLAAHAVAHAPGPVAQITALVVTNSARGTGVGRRLVDIAKDWAASRGCVRLTVTSAEPRTDAHAFYPACGLPYTGRRFTTAISPRQ